MEKTQGNHTKSWSSRWLLAFVILVILMIAVGGVTRLTRSGLSMTDWRPITGWIPPLTDADWQVNFQAYQQSPEFQQVNHAFTISDYQNIFMWEYWHRVLGRLIFLTALLPGLYFWRKAQVSGRFVTTLTLLVAAQGLVGWVMVKSGLQNEPHVSPFFLALHFFSALTVLLFAYYPLVKRRKPLLAPEISPKARKGYWALGVVLGLQVLWGCLTAGWKAGFAFNTFPLMGGEFFPPGGFRLEPWWMNILENPATVQFVHRWLGICFFLLAAAWLRFILKHPEQKALRGPTIHLLGVAGTQVVVGVLNVLWVVPIGLAVLHQLIATLLIMAYFSLAWRLPNERRQKESSSGSRAH